MGDRRRAADFLFIETQYNPKSDLSSWWKLADRYFQLEMYKNASYCYGRALKRDKDNVSLLSKKAQCYEQVNDIRG